MARGERRESRARQRLTEKSGLRHWFAMALGARHPPAPSAATAFPKPLEYLPSLRDTVRQHPASSLEGCKRLAGGEAKRKPPEHPRPDIRPGRGGRKRPRSSRPCRGARVFPMRSGGSRSQTRSTTG